MDAFLLFLLAIVGRGSEVVIREDFSIMVHSLVYESDRLVVDGPRVSVLLVVQWLWSFEHLGSAYLPKIDRIFSSMQLSKASNLELIASSGAMVYASRSIILRYLFCCRVSGMRILEKGVAG
ncbi:hypothetical protein B296_00045128 [Ensete ventricosum]|uniref:Secreted protein n=1 Tax=Ensete ventricosum TaxID=4639 RepID=A0A426X475_ENSVE|nr:hypothetical protein B296_00045128 [Ensete ventricosum]